MLPYIGDKSITRPAVRTGFRGLNHNLSAGDGEIYWMENMSGREYPLLTQKFPEIWLGPVGDDIGSYEKMYGTYNKQFWYGNFGTAYEKGSVTRGQKVFANMGKKILIFPDKKYYDIESNIFDSLTHSIGTSFTEIVDGTYAGAPAEANTLYTHNSNGWTYASQQWNGTRYVIVYLDAFKPGDAVEITGCIVRPENNKTAIVREVEGNYLRFYENTFNAVGLGYEVPAGGMAAGTYHFSQGYQFTTTEAYIEGDRLQWCGPYMHVYRAGELINSSITAAEGSGGTEITLSDIGTLTERNRIVVWRTFPDLDYVCVNENRLWGCKGDTIYASALGDPFNFNVFDGLSTDSWQSETEGKGDFTGCFSYGGYPIFFKEDCIIKVQGDRPSNFQWTLSTRFGVKAGCDKSLAVAGETLFYVSPAGVCAYNGGAPRVISDALGRNEEWSNAVAGSDGIRYYVSMQDSNGDYHVFVYDTRYGEWFREGNSHILAFTYFTGSENSWPAGLLYLDAKYSFTPPYPEVPGYDGGICCDTKDPAAWEAYHLWEAQAWTVEFADSTRFYETTDTGSQDKKGPLRLQLRCSLAQGATVKVWVMYDSSGTWQEIGTVTGATGGSAKRSYNLPLIVRRCDHYRLKLTGTGESVIYSLAEVKYSGSNLQGGSISQPSGT